MSDDVLVVQDRMTRVLSVDAPRRRARAEAGASLAAVDDALRSEGLALPSLGSIASQTVAGAIATATHGTGLAYGVLSTLVDEVTIVSGSGEVVRIARGENEAWLDGVRCHLGALGIITDVTLAVCEAFDLAVEERPASLDEVLGNLAHRVAADHYRFWYLPHADRVWEWRAVRTSIGQPRRTRPIERVITWTRERLVGYHAFELALAVAAREDRLVPLINRAYARAMFARPRTANGPSRALFNFDCLFKQHVDEWAIPIEHTARAVRALRERIATRGFRVHLPIEVRFVKGDDIWLSPCYGRDTCYVGVIAYMPYGRPTRHDAYFAEFEDVMASFGGRPHWAKRFGPGPATLQALYPRWRDFAALRAELDPSGVFANAYTDRVLGRVDAADQRGQCAPSISS
jgi:L-gulonolactone oxidase